MLEGATEVPVIRLREPMPSQAPHWPTARLAQGCTLVTSLLVEERPPLYLKLFPAKVPASCMPGSVQPRGGEYYTALYVRWRTSGYLSLRCVSRLLDRKDVRRVITVARVLD